VIPDLAAFERTFDIYSNTGLFRARGHLGGHGPCNNRSVHEVDHGAYLQADFSFDTAIPIRGDFGVRYARPSRRHRVICPPAGARCCSPKCTSTTTGCRR
jgi:hypothetical protein